MQVSNPRMKTYHEVYYETPNKRTGEMKRALASYIRPYELDGFKARIERKGGRVIRIEAARQVETLDVSF